MRKEGSCQPSLSGRSHRGNAAHSVHTRDVSAKFTRDCSIGVATPSKLTHTWGVAKARQAGLALRGSPRSRPVLIVAALHNVRGRDLGIAQGRGIGATCLLPRTPRFRHRRHTACRAQRSADAEKMGANLHAGRSRGVGEGGRRGVRGQSARRNRRTARQHPAGEPERVRDAVGELARFRPFTFDCRVVRVPEGLCVVHVIYRECEWYT